MASHAYRYVGCKVEEIDMDNLELVQRLTAVETNQQTILQNHLPHILQAIEKLDARVWIILSVIIIGFVMNLYWTHYKAKK